MDAFGTRLDEDYLGIVRSLWEPALEIVDPQRTLAIRVVLDAGPALDRDPAARLRRDVSLARVQ